MPYRIKADFILGFYQGRDLQGELERCPTPARLYAALLAGAYCLERLEGQPVNELSRVDQSVFTWLEDNPPDAFLPPETIQCETAAVAYRNKGEIKGKVDKGPKQEKASRRTFLDGPVCWYWTDAPCDEIRKRLNKIVCEVPYLGEAVCPVLVEASSVENIPQEALHRCDPSFDALELSVAQLGRWQVLQQQYEKEMSNPNKKDAKEQQQRPYVRKHLGVAYYQSQAVRNTLANPNAPWSHGYLLQVQKPESTVLSQEDYVSWALCIHRALVKQFGDDLPFIMQRMAPGRRSLANGVAIQIVADKMPVSKEIALEGSAFIVMIPANASIEEELQMRDALSKIHRLYRDHAPRNIEVVFTGERIDLARFWEPVAEGYRRIFQPLPLFIPDSRPPTKKKTDRSKWTLDDDARVAIGHTWRDSGLFAVEGSGDTRLISLAQQVDAAGIRVFGGSIVPTSNIRRYVHKTQKGSMLVGGRAFVNLDSIGCNECLAAIGQTRHLGGGLLVPTDFPVGAFASDSEGLSDE